MSAADVPTNILSYSKMRGLMKARGLKVDQKFLKDDYERNELEQIFHRPPRVDRKKFLRIVAEPRSFQVDVANLKLLKYNGYNKMLVLIDIPSRRAFAYPLKTAGMAEIIPLMDQFKKDAGKIYRLNGDNAFSAAEFKNWCSRNKVDLITDVAADDHAGGGGNKLGIVDRFCRTIKLLIRKWVVANDDDNWVDALPNILRLYNAVPNIGIKNRTPIEMWADEPAQMQRYFDDQRYNYKIKGNEKVVVGARVRIYQPRALFGKETYNYSRELYTVAEKVHNRFSIRKDGVDGQLGPLLPRLYKPHELLAVNATTLRPIAKRGHVETQEKKQVHTRKIMDHGLIPEAEAAEWAEKAHGEMLPPRPQRIRKPTQRLLESEAAPRQARAPAPAKPAPIALPERAPSARSRQAPKRLGWE